MFARRKVDFLLIGAQKCGTSSFYHYLTQNLMIEAARTKEVHYFDFFSDRKRQWYHSHFHFRKGTITGEASPFYLLHPQAALRAKKYNSKLKIIALLRDPVERAVSHYRMNLEQGFDKLPFSEALRTEEERLSASYNHDQPGSPLQHYSYKLRGMYADQLDRWATLFGRDQMLVLNYHRFFQNPWMEIQQAYGFLEVAPFFGIQEDFHENQSNNTFEITEEDRAYLQKYFEGPNKRLAEQYQIHFE